MRVDDVVGVFEKFSITLFVLTNGSFSLLTLNQSRDYPVLNNYRDVLGGLFARTWGLSPGQLQAVFPGAKPQDLQLV